MPAATAAQVKSYVLDSYNQIAPELVRTLSGELSPILSSIPSLKGQNISQAAEEIAQSASGDILNSLGKIQDSSQVAQTIASGLARSIEASSAVNPNLEDIDLSGIYKQINKTSEAIAQEHLENLENYAAIKGLSDTIDLSDSRTSQLIISDEAKSYADESEPINPEETAKKIQEHTGLFSQNYRRQLELQAGSLLATSRKPTLEEVKKAKEDAYQQAYSTIEAHLKTRESAKYQEHLRDFSQNVLPMLGLRPLESKQVEELGLGAAEPKLTAFLKKTKFSAAGVGLALSSSPRAQKEAFYSLLIHNQKQFEGDFGQVSNQIKTLRTKGKLSQDQRKDFMDARKRYAILLNARNFARDNPGKVRTYIDTFQSMEAGYRASWASQRARAVLNAFTNHYPAVPAPTISTKARDTFMSRGFFGALAFKRGAFNVNPAKAFLKVGKGANPEFAIIATAAGPLINATKKIVAAGGLGLFGLGMYFLALGKAVFTGFVIGAATGGTVGAVAGGIIGFQIGLALAPFTFGLSVPFFTVIGIAVGGTAGALLGGFIGGMIAYGLYSGSATAVSVGVGTGVGATVGTYAGAVTGAAIGTAICGPLCGLIGGTLGGMTGAVVGSFIGGLTGYAIGHYVFPFFSNAAIFAKGFFSGAFSAGGAGIGGFLGAAGSFFTGMASTMWGGLVSAGGGIFGSLSSIGGALLGGLGSGASIGSLASISVFGGIGTIAVGGTIIGITAAASFFNPEKESTPTAGIPPGASVGLWPTTGNVTQGPRGGTSHEELIWAPSNGAYQSMDIASFDHSNIPVYSTLSNGRVSTVFDCTQYPGACSRDSPGSYVIVGDNNFGIMYKHLSAISVSQGQSIDENTEIGLMGETGYAFGVHLHWEFQNIELAIPNIPQNIEPPNCDPTYGIPCSPAQVYRGTADTASNYWFLLKRSTNINAPEEEILYFGVPGDTNNSTEIKRNIVNTGIPFDDPTPLPQLAGREYWLINSVQANPGGTLGPYFISLDVPYSNPQNGPVPYLECGPSRDQQCQWTLAGNFGLHGISGADGRITDAGSSGCIRHYDADITEIYNTLTPERINSGTIRYYIESI